VGVCRGDGFELGLQRIERDLVLRSDYGCLAGDPVEVDAAGDLAGSQPSSAARPALTWRNCQPRSSVRNVLRAVGPGARTGSPAMPVTAKNRTQETISHAMAGRTAKPPALFAFPHER